MKKTFLLLAAIIFLALASFKSDNKIAVRGTIEDWSNVLNALYQSDAPHKTIAVPAINFIYNQLPDSVKTLK